MEEVEKLNKKEICIEIARFSVFMLFLLSVCSYTYKVGLENGKIFQCEDLGLRRISSDGKEFICTKYDEEGSNMLYNGGVDNGIFEFNE